MDTIVSCILLFWEPQNNIIKHAHANYIARCNPSNQISSFKWAFWIEPRRVKDKMKWDEGPQAEDRDCGVRLKRVK